MPQPAALTPAMKPSIAVSLAHSADDIAERMTRSREFAAV
jgi:hypothetical protein